MYLKRGAYSAGMGVRILKLNRVKVDTAHQLDIVKFDL